MMQGKSVFHFVGVTWLAVNVWSYIPLHKGYLGDLWVIVLWILVFANPVMFGIYAWYGRRLLPIQVVWLLPILILIAGWIVPASWWAIRGEWPSFKNVFLKSPTLLDISYFVLCSAIFVITFLLSGKQLKARKKSNIPAF